jgi:hypothetical protein
LCPRCNRHMAFIDRGIAPSSGDTVSLVAFARRCPDCPVLSVEDLVPMSGRTAFTWRLTTEQAIMMDTLMLGLKRQLLSRRGRPLGRAEMLAALVRLADDDPVVFGALVARLQDNQTS